MVSRKEKVILFLREKGIEVSRDEITENTDIDSSNLSKILSALEKSNTISRRYEQVGRSKFCYVKLTNSHVKVTPRLTNSHEFNWGSTAEDDLIIDKMEKEYDLTNSHKKTDSKETNSRTNMTNSQKSSQEEFDLNEMLEELSKTSEFKRLIYKALMGKVHRGKKEALDKELTENIQKFREGLNQ